MNVAIIDYGVGNLASVKRALEVLGCEPTILKDPAQLTSYQRIILPGVGAFSDGMKLLEENGWVPKIQEAVREKKIPLLGICLGMQLLAAKGFEGGEREGLGLIPGEIRRLVPDKPEVRIPHVGWNEVHYTNESPIFRGIPDGTDFYFVHSYYMQLPGKECEVSFTPYCGHATAAVASGHVYGVQFHPEKSGKPGIQLLKNFIELG